MIGQFGAESGTPDLKNLKKEKKLAQYGDELRPTCVEVRGSLNFSLNPTLMYKYLICLCLR